MASDFDEAESLEKEDWMEIIDETEDEDELLKISNSLELQTRQRISVPDDFNGEIWVKMSDQEWGVVETILNSPTLLYLVDNYSDYPKICPDCLAAEEAKKTAGMN
jgi:hypothetical protein